MCATSTWSVRQRTGCCCLPAFQGSVGIYITSSLPWCTFSALLLIFWRAAVCICWPSMLPLLLTEMLFSSLLSGLRSNPSAAGNPPVGQQTSGTAESHEQFCRFFFSCGCWWWLTLPKWYPDDGVSLPFQWRLPWWLWITWFACGLWVSNGFSGFSMWRFGVSLARDWALEKACRFEDPRFLVPVS